MAAIKHHKSQSMLFVYVLAFFILFSLAGFLISIRPPRITSNTSPADFGLRYEEVSFPTTDGLELKGWYIPNRGDQAKTVILLHGYPADKGDILPVLSFLSADYNLLLFDFRYLGQSQGRISTIGGRETEDLLAAIRFLKSRGIGEVGVWGFSLGGAVALMAAKEAPEIKAIVSESSYARLDLMVREFYRIPGLKYPLAYLTGMWSKIFLGIDPKNVSPAESVNGLDIPILIVHSKNDRVIPFRHALLLQEALRDNPRAEFWFEEKLAHGQVGGTYRKRIEAFFEKSL